MGILTKFPTPVGNLQPAIEKLVRDFMNPEIVALAKGPEPPAIKTMTFSLISPIKINREIWVADLYSDPVHIDSDAFDWPRFVDGFVCDIGSYPI